jgi:hypothetical protein
LRDEKQDQSARAGKALVHITNNHVHGADAIALHLISLKGAAAPVYILQAVQPEQETSK